MPFNQNSPFPYHFVENDPVGLRMHTLQNGLKVFLSVNKNEPRIFTNIVFRVGSKYDPADTTGLAHYMEHMLFKGTSRIGAVNWEEEKVLLDKIADLFERYRHTTDEAARKAIYKEIDQLSYQAALLVAPNEYDRLMTAIGAKNTNAYTSNEQTVYVNDIPSNELERWLALESERFREPALRLFHTELETVYEEFNMGQDKDFRKVYKNLMEALFPTHPFGLQTTIGKPEHLKNPSMREIERFYHTYYVPNNAAICIAGDFDPDTAISLVDKHFGTWQPVDFPHFTFEEQTPITTPIRKEVLGQESAFVFVGWRTPGGRMPNYRMAMLVRQMLYNEQAGLFDLYLNQEQLVLEAEAFTWMHADYSLFCLYGKPREGQTLEEVEQLLLREIAKLRTGDFPDWLMEAAIRDMKLGDMKSVEQNGARVGAITNSFILGEDWEHFTRRYEWLESLTKEDIIAFAKSELAPDAYAVIYKREGTDTNIIKVEKPEITAAPLQKEAVSEFAQSFLSHTPNRMVPVFADFPGSIQQTHWQPGLRFDYVYNPQNPLFRLDYIFEMGKSSGRELALAFGYLPYLGTSRYSAADIQQAFFRLGLHFEAYNYDERCHVSLTGLEESMEAGVQLMEHLLDDVQPDETVWKAVVSDLLTKRQNAKQSKDTILGTALTNYAKYGAVSPFTWRLSEAALQQLGADEVLDWVKQLHTFEHRVYYYGQLSSEAAQTIVKRHHKVADNLRPPLPPKIFTELETTQNEVLFTHFPQVQNDILMVSRGTSGFNMDEHRIHDLYNEYFGYGLSSIVFQEIRESKALAYSTYAYYNSPVRKDRAHYLRAYVGTQPDKVSDAMPALTHLMENMPVVKDSIEQARISLL
ncbi:MAG: insulinase family protein, partial [Saprospiraceae bacterium]